METTEAITGLDGVITSDEVAVMEFIEGMDMPLESESMLTRGLILEEGDADEDA